MDQLDCVDYSEENFINLTIVLAFFFEAFDLKGEWQICVNVSGESASLLRVQGFIS